MHMLTIFTEEKGHTVSDESARQDMPPAIQSTLDVLAWDRQMLEKVLHWLYLKLPRRSSNVFSNDGEVQRQPNRPRTSHTDYSRTVLDCSPDERSSPSSSTNRWSFHDSPYL